MSAGAVSRAHASSRHSRLRSGRLPRRQGPRRSDAAMSMQPKSASTTASASSSVRSVLGVVGGRRAIPRRVPAACSRSAPTASTAALGRAVAPPLRSRRIRRRCLASDCENTAMNSSSSTESSSVSGERALRTAGGRRRRRRTRRATMAQRSAQSTGDPHAALAALSLFACARASKPRAITSRWISFVPSPMIISGASR